MTNPYTILRACIAFSLTALFLTFGPVPQAAAQPAPTAVDLAEQQPEWSQHFGRQVRQLLKAPDVERRENAMQLILRYAEQLDMDIDFRPAVPALFEIYEGAEQEGQRLLALRALGAIGDESTLNRLAERVQSERSDRVREHTLRVLAAHLQRSERGQ